MSIQINHFDSRSVIMFVQMYRRSVITFVRYTVSDFQLQQKFSKVVGFLMQMCTFHSKNYMCGFECTSSKCLTMSHVVFCQLFLSMHTHPIVINGSMDVMMLLS